MTADAFRFAPRDEPATMIEAAVLLRDNQRAMSTHKTLGYYGPGFDAPQPVAVAMRYAMVSSPRTGSNYVCARIGNFRDALGIPMEYFHRDALAEFGARAQGGDEPPVAGSKRRIDLAAYMRDLERRRTTRDGCFGLKVQPVAAAGLVGGNVDAAVSFLRTFDRLIVMLRKDKLAQAVSGAIAQATGRWFNFGEEVGVSREQAAALFPEIAKHLRMYLTEEALVKAMIARLADKPTLVLHYESLLEDPEALTRQVVTFLAPGLASLPPEDATIAHHRTTGRSDDCPDTRRLPRVHHERSGGVAARGSVSLRLRTVQHARPGRAPRATSRNSSTARTSRDSPPGISRQTRVPARLRSSR